MMNNLAYITTFGDGNGTGNTNLDNPKGMAIDPVLGNIAICDSGNNRVVLWSLDKGTYIAKITTFDFNNFSDVTGVCYLNGQFFITDSGNHVMVQVRARDLKYVGHFGVKGTSGTGSTKLYNPAGICTDGIHLYITNSYTGRITKLDTNRTYIAQSLAILNSPSYIEYIKQEKRFIVANTASDELLVINTKLKVEDTFGSSGTGDGELNAPRGIVAVGDKLHVIDTVNSRLQVLNSSTGSYVDEQGEAGTGNTDLDNPYGIAYYRDVVFITQQGTSDNIKLWYTCNPQRELTSGSDLTFTDFDGQNYWAYANDTMVAGATGDVNSVLFSDNFESGAKSDWVYKTSSRWSVIVDEGDNSLSINTTDYDDNETAAIGTTAYGDFMLELKVKTPENLTTNPTANFIIMFGYQDDDNNYFLKISKLNYQNILYRAIGGSSIVLDLYHHETINDNEYQDVKIKKAGSSITVYYGGNLIMSVTDDTYATGQILIGARKDAIYFDDVILSELIAEGEAEEAIPRFKEEFKQQDSLNWSKES